MADVITKCFFRISSRARREIMTIISDEMMVMSDCGRSIIRIPTVIEWMTDGGYIEEDELIRLGKIILRSPQWGQNKPDENDKVEITKRIGFDPTNNEARKRKIKIVYYGKQHLEKLWDICSEWVSNNTHKIKYKD